MEESEILLTFNMKLIWILLKIFLRIKYMKSKEDLDKLQVE